MNKLILTVVLLAGMNAFTHEGHDKMPGTIQAPHGGVVMTTKETYMEVVQDPTGVKLYPLTHELKPIPMSEISATATAQAPKKKAVKVELKNAGDHFVVSPDIKGAHRYELKISMKYKGKNENVKFQVEQSN